MKTIARKRVFDADAEWSIIQELLPKGWEPKARDLGAVRRLRGVPDVKTLLRILLLHLADGCSLKETSLRIAMAGWARLSAVGILKRLRLAKDWLAWMAQQMHKRTWPERQGRRYLAVDATTVQEPGRTGSLYRVHWCVNLFNLQCEFFEVTDVHGGEKFSRFPLSEGDLVMGDRGYSGPPGIDHVRVKGGHVLIRVNPASLPLYDRRDGKKLSILSLARGMAVNDVHEWTAWVKGLDGRWHRGRLLAVRRSLAATQREVRRRQRIMGHAHQPLSPKGRALAKYFLLWTSLPASELGTRAALKCFRLRWQLELVFKRVKSIMGLGKLPKYSDASSQAWLNGKLLVALLVEKLWRMAESFSPWGYAAPRPAKPLA